MRLCEPQCKQWQILHRGRYRATWSRRHSLLNKMDFRQNDSSRIGNEYMYLAYEKLKICKGGSGFIGFHSAMLHQQPSDSRWRLEGSLSTQPCAASLFLLPLLQLRCAALQLLPLPSAGGFPRRLSSRQQVPLQQPSARPLLLDSLRSPKAPPLFWQLPEKPIAFVPRPRQLPLLRIGVVLLGMGTPRGQWHVIFISITEFMVR